MSATAASQRLSVGPLALAKGARLHDVEVAYATYGRLAPDGRNAILATHGYTASHLMLAHGAGVAEGSWAPLIGPGKPLDTDRYFIVCSNMLGSSYGTTGPGSIDAATGAPYGADCARWSAPRSVASRRCNGRSTIRTGSMPLA